MDDRVVTILGEASAINAAAVLETRLPEADFLDWLSDIRADIPISKAIRLARAWGKQGVAQVKKNPFLLLAVSDWKTVEAIAEGLAIPKTDVRRQIAALEAVLMGQEGLEGGSTLMPDARALQLAERLLGCKPCPSVIDKAVRSGAAIRLVGGLQPPGAAHMEAACALHLLKLAPQPPCSGRTPKGRLADLITKYEGAQPFPLTERQREAIKKSHDHRLLILAGYAGSGKTTVLKAICETQEAIRRTPLIVTLSGRAAQRASEATGRPAITVARFLLLQEKSHSVLGADQVLIADEASMIGLVEFWRILRWLGDASLVLCGDPAQLPPVSPGVVFNALCASRSIVSVVLDRVHRQDERTGIPKFAERIRIGLAPEMTGFSGAEPGVTFVPCSKGDLCNEITRIGVEISRGGGTREEMQIIAPTNAGIGHINDFFHRRLVRRKPNLWPHIEHIAEGEPVIWTRNDPQRRLTNGSLGRIVKIEGETILAELDGQLHYLSPADRQFIDLAWAISVHKAQGSQWKRVIIPIFESKIVDRSLIYTALTRAQEQVVFVGSYSSIRRAVEDRAVADMRYCGFEVWLNLACREQRRAQIASEASTRCALN
ncbi:AAA family ATPase [Sulfitobacter sp. M22]|uniref:AAA family ATPase n=1 Tax=Sulfitobacter sp. M22 TaxID=2675332 RepID=UPI001F3DBE0A|nr:AAA family ATPase [Sulfitobacter sp. M22]